MDDTSTMAESRLPMRSLRERQRGERATLILEAAQQVFSSKGYHDATIDEIAAHVGVAKGTVYLHFASKEDLLVALVEQQLTGFLLHIDRVSGEALLVRDRLERILLDVYTRMHEQRNQILLELNTRFGLTRSVIDRRKSLGTHIAHAMERIAALLEEGKGNGELDCSVPTPIMVATFITLISPGGYENLLTTGQVSPGDLATYVSRTFFPNTSTSSNESLVEEIGA